MAYRLKKFETYAKFMENNADWWEDTFTAYQSADPLKLAVLKGLVWKWYKYRRIGSLDEEKFAWYLEREIENVWDRWLLLTDFEEFRDSEDVFNQILTYNTNDYELTSETGRRGTETQADTGTIQNQGSDNRTLNTQSETDYTGTQSRANTGTQTNVVDGEIKDTGTQNSELTLDTENELSLDTSIRNTGTQTTANTGTQTDSGTSNETIQNTGTQTTTENGDNRSLSTNLPQSITAGDGQFETHFDGIDGEPNPVHNTQAGWHTAGAKAETKNNGTAQRTDNLTEGRQGANSNTRTDNLQSQRTDNLSTANSGTETTTRTGTETTLRTDNLKRENDETTTRTDNLNEAQTRNLKDLTRNTGTDNLARTNTQTNNLARNTTNSETTNTDTDYTTKGRTNHSPYECIKEAINKVISFCSTDWLREQLNPCFYLLVALDDYDDQWEEVEDE